jgi:long-chain fatty acid transport protein
VGDIIMCTQSKWFTAVVVAFAVFAAGSAHATNGYFTHGVGTKNKGMAGAGIALPQDSIDTVNNPAVAVLIGENMQLGAALFSPRRSYSTSDSQLNGQMSVFTIGPNDIDSDSEYFVIPHFSRSWQQTETRAFALSFYGRGGMNTGLASQRRGIVGYRPDAGHAAFRSQGRWQFRGLYRDLRRQRWHDVPIKPEQ